MANRFKLFIVKDSNDTWGWNGFVKDEATGNRHSLIKTFIDYELDGEIGYGTAAFDTRAELVAAARRKARTLARAA